MSITSLEELKKHIDLTEDEKGFDEGRNGLPILISDSIMSLMSSQAIRRQFVPSSAEQSDALGNLDPLMEVEHTASERLIHRYRNRAALLMTDCCFAYCRHCFRRRFTATEQGPISDREIEDACSYLAVHDEIKEVLLTGGDMFTLSDSRLDTILSRLKAARKDIIYRLCTRALLSNPSRFTDKLFDVIGKNSEGAPYVLMTQFNHADEITKQAKDIVLRFLQLGIPAYNQAVLLRGVNDSVDEQERLANTLMDARIKPYYLFQGDFVNGTGHLRVPLSRGLEIEKELRLRLSGLAMPQYTLDLPEGGGKVILTKDYLVERNEDGWIFESPYGGIRYYPEDI